MPGKSLPGVGIVLCLRNSLVDIFALVEAIVLPYRALYVAGCDICIYSYHYRLIVLYFSGLLFFEAIRDKAYKSADGQEVKQYGFCIDK